MDAGGTGGGRCHAHSGPQIVTRAVICIAVAGLGSMGARHLAALRNVPGAVLAAVVSGDASKLNGDLTGVGGNLGHPGEWFDFSGVRKFASVQMAIDDPDIDAIDICLPSNLHFSVAMAALQAGKHVLVEKPLSLAADQADALVAEARQRGCILMVGHVLRYFPEYVALADALAAGHLGSVRSAFFRRRCAAPSWSRWLTDVQRSGGAVMDLLIHDIDFCLHLFGKPNTVSAVGFSNLATGVDWIEARLEYPAMGPVVITGGWHHPKSYPFSMEFTVVSDGGTLEYRSGGEPLMLYDASGLAEKVTVREDDPFVAELIDFAAYVSSGTWPQRCPPEESALAVRMAGYITQSRELQGERVECQ